MIGRLRGTIVERNRDSLLVDVNGVGYLVAVAGSTLAAAGPDGAEIILRTYLYVREDALQLFGFLTADEKETFERLLGVTGVGTKVALSVLTQFTPAELSEVVARRDATALTAAQGVGKRLAERMLLDLEGKLSPGGGSGPVQRGAAADDLTEALVGLGFAPAEAAAAAAAVPGPQAAAFEERFTLALRQLDRRRT